MRGDLGDFPAEGGAVVGGGAVVLAATILLPIVLGLIARGWSDLEYYGAFAGLLVAICIVGGSWVEFAPDGAFRRRRRSA